MKKIEIFVIYLVCFLLQSAVFSHLSIFGVSPNFILALTIIFSFFFEDYTGIVMSMIFGLVQDICFGQVVGISALVYLCIGLGLQFVRVRVYRDNKIILLFLTIIGTLVYYTGYWLLSMLMLQMDISALYVFRRVPVAVICNYVVLLVVYFFVRKREGFTV